MTDPVLSRLDFKHVEKGGGDFLGKEKREKNPMACLCVRHQAPASQDQEVN